MMAMPSMPEPMAQMEHPEDTVGAPPLVNDRLLIRFRRAVQGYADSAGFHDDAAAKLLQLQARLANLRNLAALCRLAIIGHPHSFARVIDEMHCLAVDFPPDPLDSECDDEEPHEDETDNRVQLAAAVDLFAGAAFVSRNNLAQRDRFIIGIVRAIEDAIAFPVTFAAEAKAYIGEGAGELSPSHTSIVIANATQRLIEGDYRCVPLAPLDIRCRLECLARKWMLANPVNAFFDAISGPRLRRIVHWEDPALPRPDDARVGDRVTLLLEQGRDEDKDCGHDTSLDDLAVMFCPHQPAPVVRTLDDGLQVLVPNGARTGPIAVVKKSVDFTAVQDMIARYADQFSSAWSLSIFALARIDRWAYPCAFGRPIIEIMDAPSQPPRQPPPPANPSTGTIK
jgi:hypothetical protein